MRCCSRCGPRKGAPARRCSPRRSRSCLPRGPASGCRLADLDGDQPAIFGLGAEPELGLLDWLAAGPETPTEALDRLAVEVAPGVALLPLGGPAPQLTARPEAVAGAALAVALRDGPHPVVVDCGHADEPASRAVAEVADATVAVVRGCYLDAAPRRTRTCARLHDGNGARRGTRALARAA